MVDLVSRHLASIDEGDIFTTLEQRYLFQCGEHVSTLITDFEKVEE